MAVFSIDSSLKVLYKILCDHFGVPVIFVSSTNNFHIFVFFSSSFITIEIIHTAADILLLYLYSRIVQKIFDNI